MSRPGAVNADYLAGATLAPLPVPPAIRPATPEEMQAAARTKLLLGSGGQVVAVAGLDANDGATALSARLAAAMAALDRRPVAIVDGNFGSPALHEWFAVPRVPGLLDVMAEGAPLGQAVHPTGVDNLSIVPAGASVSGAAALLSSPEGAGAIRAIRERFRYVFIDTGAMLLDPGAMLLGSLSDGVVAAVAAGARTQSELAQFRDRLREMRLNLLGVVLTRGAARR